MANKYAKRCQCHQENARPNYSEMPLHLHQGTCSQTDSAFDLLDGEKQEPLCTAGGNERGCIQPLREKNVSSPNGERRNPRQPAVPLLGMHARELKSSDHTKACTQMFTEAFTHNSPNGEASQLSINRKWILKRGLSI
ncbi:unnamed protein product [Rangifer tarandus platyrhynchus]|uniref:Uncharacterized protein n=1 Tax=Rangifer tarandus platyrhynchus TaxID=3082113 RepID=A0ABN8Y7U3_RANTA|nr:unnamed protein product [Rangifer tarandus platyrhynchus]